MLYLVRDRTGHQAALALAAAAIIVAAPCSAITFSVYGLFHEVPFPYRLSGYLCRQRAQSAERLRSHLLCDLPATQAHPPCVDRGHYLRARFPATHPGATVPTPAADDVLAAQLAAAGAEAGRSAVRADRNGEPAGVTSDQTTADLFFGRLSPEVGRDVVYLKMSGHYLEVVTTVASATILMRFADAIANLGDSGMRVHARPPLLLGCSSPRYRNPAARPARPAATHRQPRSPGESHLSPSREGCSQWSLRAHRSSGEREVTAPPETSRTCPQSRPRAPPPRMRHARRPTADAVRLPRQLAAAPVST